MKRALSVIFIVVILSLGAIIVAPAFIDLNIYKSKASSEFKERTGFDLELGGDLDFSLFPAPRFIASSVSITPPKASSNGSKNNALLSFERLDINLDLIPLFSKKISVKSIMLVKPIIAVEAFKDGSLNIGNNIQKTQGTYNASDGGSGLAFDISLDKIRVKDGSFSYMDHKTGAINKVQNINADLSASSLSGPFKAQGSMFYDGQALDFDLSTSSYDGLSKVMPLDADININPIGININYAGVMSLDGEPSIQGQTSITTQDIEPINMPLKAKAMLSANFKKLDYKDFNISIGGAEFNGSLEVGLVPFKYSLSLKSLYDIALKDFALDDLPFEKASIELNIIGNDKALTAKNSTIKLDDNILKVSGKAKYIQDIIDIKANIAAMGGEAIITSKVKDDFAMEDITLQVKHRNMAQAIKILTGANINDKNLKKPLDFYAKITQRGKKYSLNDIKGDLSGTSVKGNLEIDIVAKKPKIKGELAFSSLNIVSIMKPQISGNPNNRGTNPTSKTAARWSKEPIDVSALHAINADISLSAQNIKYGAWFLAKPSFRMVLSDGILNISDLSAGLLDGTITLDTNIKSVAKPRQPIHFDSNAKFENVDLGKLSNIMLGSQLVRLSGAGDFSINIKTSGASPAALIHDLSGAGEVGGSDIILHGVDVTRFARALSEDNRLGDSMMGLWKGASKGGKSVFDTLDGAFVIENGVVQINKMDLDGTASTIETRGNINLPNWTLATKHKITIKGSDVTPSDVPPFGISFNGSLDNPAQTFGQGLLDDYINRKVKRKLNKLLSEKLGVPSNDLGANDLGANDNQVNDNDSTPSPSIEDVAEEALENILGDLLR